jgi:VanZ family protein
MFDKQMHALVFAMLACVPVKLNRWVIAVILITPFLGELSQFFMDTRTPSLQDAIVGACGAGAVICLRILYREIAPVVRRYRDRKRKWNL